MLAAFCFEAAANAVPIAFALASMKLIMLLPCDELRHAAVGPRLSGEAKPAPPVPRAEFSLSGGAQLVARLAELNGVADGMSVVAVELRLLTEADAASGGMNDVATVPRLREEPHGPNGGMNDAVGVPEVRACGWSSKQALWPTHGADGKNVSEPSEGNATGAGCCARGSGSAGAAVTVAAKARGIRIVSRVEV